MSRRPFFPFDRRESVVVPSDQEVPPMVDALFRKLDLIQKLVETLMPTMQDLRDAVQRNTNANQSIMLVLQGVSQQLKDAQASNDPNAIQSVIDQLDANTQALANAATANTAAAPQSGGQTPPPAGPPPA